MSNNNHSRVIEITKALLTAQMIERDSEKAVSYLSEDVFWFGTGNEEEICSKSEAYKYFETEKAKALGSFNIEYINEGQKTLANNSGIANFNLKVEAVGIVLNCRLTSVTKEEEGEEKICSLHASVPDKNQKEDEFFPYSLSQRYADEMYREFIESSMNAGVVGAYVTSDLPLYTVNHQFIEMLGYSSEEEFIKETSGCCKNLVHPDDFHIIDKQIQTMFETNGQTCVSYRVQKKDGTYILLEDRGKLVTAENGEIVLISICLDITKQRETIDKLKNQAEQLRLQQKELATTIDTVPGGFFKYKADKSQEITYYSKNMLAMLGYTAEEFNEKFGNRFDQLIWYQDRERVLKEIEEQASTMKEEGTDTCEYRIEKKDGSLLWVHDVGHLVTDDAGLKWYYVVIVDITQTKNTEEQLHIQQQETSFALDNADIFLWEYNPYTHQTTQQKKWMELFGVPKVLENMPEPINTSGMVDEDSKADVIRLYTDIDNGALFSEIKCKLHTVKGDVRWLRCSLRAVLDANGRTVKAIGLGIDITDQFLAEQRFKEELEYSEATSDDKLLVRVRSNITKGTIDRYIADETTSFGKETSVYNEGLLLTSELGFTEEDKQLILQKLSLKNVLKEFEKGNNEFSFNYRRVLKTGDAIWVKTTVKIYRDNDEIKSFMYTTNINNEQINKEIISKVSELEHDYIMLIELKTDKWTLYLGDNDDLLASSAADPRGYVQVMISVNKVCVHPEDLDQCIASLSPENIKKNLKNKAVFSAVYRFFDKNGKVRQKKMQYAWLNEELEQVVLTRSDVTELVEEQQRQKDLLKSALIQAEHASNAKTDFLSKMSHEIRTPMNAIIGMNALAAQAINDPKTVSDCIAKVGISARFLLSLINDILDMSRIESGKVNLRDEKMPFEEFVNGINTIIYEQASSKKLSYDSIVLGNVASSYSGDAMKLQQILVNLLGNSIKFTPQGGKIQLIISQERVNKNKAYVKFVVNDTGVGISEEFQKIMFNSFTQEYSGTTTPYGGTGLGLAITKNLVTLMGGTINVNSIVGVGTEFTVIVPLTVCDEENVHYSKDIPFDKLNALIVDDEILICEQVQTLLTDMGIKAEWVDTGRKAIELVKAKWKSKKAYDIIFVDWKMPEMDGIEIARNIRALVGPDVTIIIITAYEWVEIEKEAKAAGVNMLITKPLFKSSLISTFEKIFSKKEVAKATPKHTTYDFSYKRILLVEDHILNVEVARRLLQAKGMEVEVAENGLIAIEAFASQPIGYFDAILMDIRMPVMDGLTATRSIRQLRKANAKTIPIIAMSANAFDEDIEKSRLAGMSAHLSKPIEPQLLYDTLAQYLEKEK